MKFEELGIIAPILEAVREAGYTEPSPIQAQAIPPALKGRDILGCAQTGTGKTAAFAIPILQILQKAEAKDRIRALILTPTRELALQIFENIKVYGGHLLLRCCVIFGGVPQHAQEEELRKGTDILVATPGRLNDLVQQKIIALDGVELFVLDEADRMLDMGFIHDVNRVIEQIPSRRQTMLFSATMPAEVRKIVNRILRNPVHVQIVPPATTVEAIDQRLYFVDKPNKRKLLIHLLKDPGITSVLVFTRTKHGADRVARDLQRAKIQAQAIHGDKSQNARQNALKSFKEGRIRVLVATDIAARGIDIEELSHVINFDLPNIPETYVHRIGRTGRAGLSGVAISFCDIEEKPYLADIEKLIGKSVPVVADHPYPMQILTPPEKKPQERRPQEKQEEKRLQGNAEENRISSRPSKSPRKPESIVPASPGRKAETAGTQNAERAEQETPRPLSKEERFRKHRLEEQNRQKEGSADERPKRKPVIREQIPRKPLPRAPLQKSMLERTTSTKKPTDQVLRAFAKKG